MKVKLENVKVGFSTLTGPMNDKIFPKVNGQRTLTLDFEVGSPQQEYISKVCKEFKAKIEEMYEEKYGVEPSSVTSPLKRNKKNDKILNLFFTYKKLQKKYTDKVMVEVEGKEVEKSNLSILLEDYKKLVDENKKQEAQQLLEDSMFPVTEYQSRDEDNKFTAEEIDIFEMVDGEKKKTIIMSGDIVNIEYDHQYRKHSKNEGSFVFGPKILSIEVVQRGNQYTEYKSKSSTYQKPEYVDVDIDIKAPKSTPKPVKTESKKSKVKEDDEDAISYEDLENMEIED